MKTATLSVQFRPQILVCVLLLVLTSTLRAQTQVYSPDALIRIGQDAYLKQDYVAASFFLFAYIQSRPSLMATNPEFAAQVQSAFTFSQNNVREGLQKGTDCRNAQQAKSAGGLGSTSSGLSSAPPRLEIPR